MLVSFMELIGRSRGGETRRRCYPVRKEEQSQWKVSVRSNSCAELNAVYSSVDP